MSPEEVKQLIESAIPGSEATVESPDGSHFTITVVSSVFEGQSLVNKQRTVYAAINEQITSGAMHAVDTMNTYTPEEWQQASKLQIS